LTNPGQTTQGPDHRSIYKVQMHKSGRTVPSARDFADRPAIRRSLLKGDRLHQTQE